MRDLSRMPEAMIAKARGRTMPFRNGIRLRSDSRPIIKCSALGGEERVSSRLPLRQYKTMAGSGQDEEAAFAPPLVTVRGLHDGDRTAREHFILKEETLSTRGNATGKRGNLKKGAEIVGRKPAKG